jgi:hypothetical protein
MVAAGRLAARASYHCSLLYQQADLRALAELAGFFAGRLDEDDNRPVNVDFRSHPLVVRR